MPRYRPESFAVKSKQLGSAQSRAFLPVPNRLFAGFGNSVTSRGLRLSLFQPIHRFLGPNRVKNGPPGGESRQTKPHRWWGAATPGLASRRGDALAIYGHRRTATYPGDLADGGRRRTERQATEGLSGRFGVTLRGASGERHDTTRPVNPPRNHPLATRTKQPENLRA